MLSHDSMAFPKGSPLLPFFNNAYNKLRQTGALQRIKEKWSNKSIPVKCESDPLEPISFHKIVFVIALLFFGCSCATTILVFEIVYKAKNSNVIECLFQQKMYCEESFDVKLR